MKGNQNAKKHGMYTTAFYQAWRSMRARCGNPNRPGYRDYGGRGIKVCERWNSFENFKLDMLPTHSPGLSLDRINNEGDYEPSNCRWANNQEQSNNTRRNKLITHGGRTQTISAWAREVGIHHRTIWGRIFKQAWDPVRAITTPTNRQYRRKKPNQ